MEPLTAANLIDAKTYGTEVSAKLKLTDRWSIAPEYAFGRAHAHLDPSSHDPLSVAKIEGYAPVHWARLDSHVRIGRTLLWDTNATYVDRLRAPHVPSYTRVDSQLTWSIAENISLTFAGQNLLRDTHLEFIDPDTQWPSSLMKRSGYVKLTWRF